MSSIMFSQALPLIAQLATKLVECSPSFLDVCKPHMSRVLAGLSLGNRSLTKSYLAALEAAIDNVDSRFLRQAEVEFRELCRKTQGQI